MRVQFSTVVTALALLGSSITAIAAETPFEDRQLANAPANATFNTHYRLLRPAEVKPDQKYPLVIYLHGAGSKGDDNLKQLGEPVPKLFANKAIAERFPCFMLVPQCRTGDNASGRPNNWVNWAGQKENKPPLWLHADAEPTDQLRGAMACLDDVLNREPIDLKRIYLTGVSMGGAGSWNWTAREPERFAAVVPVCGLSEVEKAPAIAKANVWTFHGGKDEQVPVERTRNLAEAIKTLGGKTFKYTEVAEAGHGVAQQVFTRNDYEVFTWLFKQRKP